MDRRKIAHYTVFHEPGSYELIVQKGEYYIFAFGDKNRNLVYESGEPAGQYISPEPVSASGGGVVSGLDIVIFDKIAAVTGDFPIGSAISKSRPKKLHSTLAGAIADLDGEAFSKEYGVKGYWEPVQFFKEVGGNIYFLEAYDPAKTPILFVHGAAGSPQNWRYFVENIDSNRYQPWFFYYPSGAPLKSMASLLNWKLTNLKFKYKFQELYITAHSMGGLLVRSFLGGFGKYFPYVKLFVSISTPWGGEELAEFGVKHSPAVIPSWKDMQPEGEFIKSIFQKSVSPEIEYYLFFGHKGSRNPIRPNNDKVITLASQLDLRPQSEAKMIYGFNEDHTSILSSRDVLVQYNTVLDAMDKSGSTGSVGGYFRVHFSYNYPDESPKPQALLLIRPVVKDRDETILFLNPEDTGRKLGPFPSGDYHVSMIASSFKPEPVKANITIEEGKVSSLNFLFTPWAVLAGYVAKKPDTDKYPMGLRLPPDENVKIRSITLTGWNLKRELSPLNGENANYYDYYLSGKDYAHKAGFSFFGLPPGEYELQLKAEGYEVYTKKCIVVPGKFGNFRVIELSPLTESLNLLR